MEGRRAHVETLSSRNFRYTYIHIHVCLRVSHTRVEPMVSITTHLHNTDGVCLHLCAIISLLHQLRKKCFSKAEIRITSAILTYTTGNNEEGVY